MLETKSLTFTVYGAAQICASCVGAPGSKDTYEWLQAAISRKYIDDPITYEYIDINNPPDNKKHEQFVEQIIEDDLLYPLVCINGEIIAEGIPRLKPIYQELEKNGIALQG